MTESKVLWDDNPMRSGLFVQNELLFYYKHFLGNSNYLMSSEINLDLCIPLSKPFTQELAKFWKLQKLIDSVTIYGSVIGIVWLLCYYKLNGW